MHACIRNGHWKEKLLAQNTDKIPVLRVLTMDGSLS